MLSAHPVARIRAAEDLLMARTPAGALMARAATGLAVTVADWLRQRRGRLLGARVLLVVGAGSNGGDALFAGAWLARRGVAVRWMALSTSTHTAGTDALHIAGGRPCPVEEVAAQAEWADVALDAVVGIGGRPGLSPAATHVFGVLAAHGVDVIAVDLPSGVDPDTGETPRDGRHVQAAMTVTFGTHKVATLVDPAASACGEVRLVDIGLDETVEPGSAEVTLWEATDVAAALRVPGRADHKYTRGVVGIRAGSSTYPGAGVLCVAGAATGLAGMVRFVGDEDVAARVRARFPEVVGSGRVQAWAVGSGGAHGAREHLVAALDDGVPVVADADAVGHARDLLTPGHGHDVLLTPHAGELAHLLGVDRTDVEARPVHHARAAAARWEATVLLKGNRTVVVSPTGHVHVAAAGTGWLGTAGSGDVLAGLIAALAATGLPLADAGAAGAWLHGRAAREIDGPLVAGDLPHQISEVSRRLLGGVGE